ncbi:MAG: hypothetical protein J6V09_01855 [Clostridia bacterium]|nr:hypothetical protein [Clostridia bacterium]
MKKLFALLICIITCITLLASCDKPHTHRYIEWEYDEYKHWRGYACGCDLEGELDIHINDDGDEFCDVCGYEVGIKTDYVLFCLYYYVNQYGSHTQTQIYDIDLSVLVEIANSKTFISGDPGSSPTKIQYSIRHYNTETDSFFITGNEQYLDITEKYTNKHADATYYIDYVNSRITRMYTTLSGEVEEYASLEPEELYAIKEAFKPIADYLEPNTQK